MKEQPSDTLLNTKDRRRGRVYVLMALVLFAPLLLGGCLNSPSVTIGGSTASGKGVSAPGIAGGFTQLKMFDANDGWGLTTTSVLTTTDGGATWTDVTPTAWEPLPGTNQQITPSGPTTPMISNGFFLDDTHGWIFSTHTPVDATITATNNNGTVTVNSSNDLTTTISVMATIDGGKTWMQVATPLTVKNASSIQPYFINSHEGWMEVTVQTQMSSTTNTYSNTPLLYHTVDGGIDWSAVTLPGALANSGLKEGLTMAPYCTTNGDPNATPPLPICSPPDLGNKDPQACTVTGAGNALGWMSGEMQNSVWLQQTTDSAATWANIAGQTPGGAPGQTNNSQIVTSAPIMFPDGQGVLPIQMQSDPTDMTNPANSINLKPPTNFYLHLYHLNLNDPVGGLPVGTTQSDLSTTTDFAVPLIPSIRSLSVLDSKHIFVIGQAHNNSTDTYGNWGLYKLNGANWQLVNSQVDATLPAAPAGQVSPVFNASLTTLDFVSRTDGWATSGPTLYHIKLQGNNAVWSQIFPTPNMVDTQAELDKLVTRTPGKVVQPPTNPQPCPSDTTNPAAGGGGVPAGWVFTKSPLGADQSVTVNATSYGFDDNSGQTESQYTSSDIAYPKGQYHTAHTITTEGTGAYNDPITFATPDKNLSIFPIGSIMYVPYLEKYFVMEDQCGDGGACQQGIHVDLWMGPPSWSDPNALNNCEDKITRNSAQVIANPNPNYPVDPTKMFQNNTCTVVLHG